MRRVKLIVAVGVVVAAIFALGAGPAMADEFDGVFFAEDVDDEVVVLIRG